MKTQSLIAAVAFAFAGSAAMAQEVTVDATVFHATKTRAEVRAEVLKARAEGTLLPVTEFEAQVRPVVAAVPSALTRAEVRAEVLKAHAAGTLQFATEFDAQVQPIVVAAPSQLTREQVRAEARAVARSNRRDTLYTPG
jgi:hypothetical protein